MKLKQYQIDAFTDKVFSGNPAAVVPLESWPDDQILQAIAEENNLSETAFFAPSEKDYRLRWFTPVREVDLCGHATLAAAYVVFEVLGRAQRTVLFQTRSGELTVEKRREQLYMSFPSTPPVPCAMSETLIKGLGARPIDLLAAVDYMAVFESEADVRAITPDHAYLSQLDLRGVIVTAPGTDSDFVSRFFAPKFGIPEDPVTGSAHCALAPYWADKLGKKMMKARQVSKRGGEISCELAQDRVILCGSAVRFMEAEITL